MQEPILWNSLPSSATPTFHVQSLTSYHSRPRFSSIIVVFWPSRSSQSRAQSFHLPKAGECLESLEAYSMILPTCSICRRHSCYASVSGAIRCLIQQGYVCCIMTLEMVKPCPMGRERSVCFSIHPAAEARSLPYIPLRHPREIADLASQAPDLPIQD